MMHLETRKAPARGRACFSSLLVSLFWGGQWIVFGPGSWPVEQDHGMPRQVK